MTKHIIFALFIAMSVPAVTGCGQVVGAVQDLFAPKIDATTMDTFIESVQKVRDDLKTEDRDKFDTAIAYFSIEYAKEHPGAALAAGAAALFADDDRKVGGTLTGALAKDFIQQFDGKTARAIISDYEKAKK